MNKTLIALAVASTAVAAGANAGEVYNQDGTTLSVGGRAEARLSIADGNAEDQSRARLNIKGTQELAEGLYGVGFYEAEYETDDNGTGDSRDTRYVYAGIGSQAGLVTYGKNDAALGVITDFTDIMAYHGAVASAKFTSADREDNMLTYAGSFGDVAVKAAYRFADRTTTGTGTAAEYDSLNNSGYNASVIYTVADTGVALGAGYADQDSTTSTATNGGNQYMLTASYTLDNVYLAGLYTAKDLDHTSNDYQGYELAARYSLNQASFTTTYGYAEYDDASDASKDALAVEAAYNFKPNFKGYISYNFNLLDENEAGSKAAAEDDAVLGLLYSF